MKTHVRDVPQHLPVFDHLKAQYDWEALTAIPTAEPHPLLMRFPLIGTETLRESTEAALAEYGTHGWISEGKTSLTYGGLSITYNPTLQYDHDHNAHTLGAPNIPESKFFFGSTETQKCLRDSYFDTYGFRLLAPAVKGGALGDFLRRSTRTLVRGRIAVIDGGQIAKGHAQSSGWHRDESIFHCLRVNIPLVTDRSYAFQIEGGQPVWLEPEYAYSWDTNRTHRAYLIGQSDIKRVHIVLGFSPWFDYLPNEDAWVANEYLGKMHPFDMLAQGLVHPDIHA